jgi:hypothetical protein
MGITWWDSFIAWRESLPQGTRKLGGGAHLPGPPDWCTLPPSGDGAQLVPVPRGVLSSTRMITGAGCAAPRQSEPRAPWDRFRNAPRIRATTTWSKQPRAAQRPQSRLQAGAAG